MTVMDGFGPEVRLRARQLVVVQMHGEPGSGKSTLAQALGRAIGVTVLDKDVIKSALLRTGLDEAAASGAAYEAYFDLAASLLQQRKSIVLDNPVFWPQVEDRSLTLAREACAAYAMVECVCPDRAELARRLALRDALPSQPRAPLDRARTPGTIEPSCPRLTLDTTRPLHELLREAVAYVRTRASARLAAVQRPPMAAPS